MSKRVKLLPLLLITSSLVLAGCGKSANQDADTTAENSLSEADHSSEAAEPQLAKVDYWKAVGSHLAGSYSAACLRMPMAEGKQHENATLTIGADGKYTFKEFSGNLRTGLHAMFHRQHDADGVAGLVFNAASDDAQLGLFTGDDPDELNLSFTKGTDTVIVCEPAKGTIALAGKPLHSVFASVLDSPPRKINCIRPGSMVLASLTYASKNGAINLGDNKYDLAKMDESVVIGDGLSNLNYTASVKDQGVSVGLDEHGKVISVSLHGKEGAFLACSVD